MQKHKDEVDFIKSLINVRKQKWNYENQGLYLFKKK